MSNNSQPQSAVVESPSDQQSNSPARESHIRIEDLRKTFDDGAVVACDDINISIGQGEFVVFLGPSGCGKTTTLRCIAGLEEPDTGRILVDGENIIDYKSKDRNLAFVFQNVALFPHMSVRKNIQFGLDMNTDASEDEKDERVRSVAETLGIEETLDRKPSALSGGQQQRVSLGRAMVMEPAAFLLDEPFSALDANLRDQMRIEAKKLQRELNTAMIFVTHDQEEAMTLGDKVVVMNEGHIQQIGTPHEIYNDPHGLFVADFIGSPSPNQIEGTVVFDGTEASFESDVFTIQLTEEQSEALNEHGADSVIFGIRPEYLDVNSTAPDFEADLDVIEPLGDRDAVHLSAGDRSFSALTQQGTIEPDQTTIAIGLQVENGWFFDSDTSNRIV